MAAVIKQAQSKQSFEPITFRFEDAVVQASERAAEARTEADAILAEARRDADNIRRLAQEEGLQAGLQHAEQSITENVDWQMKLAMPILHQATVELADAKIAWQRRWETAAVELAIKIAEKVVRQKIARTSSIALGLAREALEMCSGAPEIKIHLHPEDFSALEAQVMQIVHELARAARTTVVPDEAISRGGCKLETQHGVIDQQIESRLARIAAELIGPEA